jgi:hypothetical protein
MITRNRVRVLETLAQHPEIKRPDWDAVHRNRLAFEEWFNSLPKKHRQLIQLNRMNRLLADIQQRPGERESAADMRPKVKALVLQLFPKSRVAADVRMGKEIF